jgi:hypothetical protein
MIVGTSRIQRRNASRLLLEALAVLLPDLLARHDAAQARVPRLPHFAHASRADGRQDFVWAEFGAGCECHFLSLQTGAVTPVYRETFSASVQLRTTWITVGITGFFRLTITKRLPSSETS